MALVISDLHLGDGGDSDEFKQGGQGAKLWELLDRQPDRSVVLLGDVLDLLRCSLWDIEVYWEILLEMLFRKAKVWIGGNHDAEALNFLESQYRGVPIRQVLVEGDTIFLHGHQFDTLANETQGLRALITIVENWVVEQTSPDVGAAARQLESELKGGRSGEMTTYANRALDYIQNFWIGKTRINRIVMGHTHQPDRQIRDDLEVINTGCWIGGRADQFFIP